MCRWLRASLGFPIGVPLVICCMPSGVAQAYLFPKPATTQSYYIQSTSRSLMYERGCDAAHYNDEHDDYRDMAILDFGGQLAEAEGTESTDGEVEFKEGQIEALTLEFAEAYYLCDSGETDEIVVMGTNNDKDAVDSEGGEVWADMAFTVDSVLYEDPAVADSVGVWGGSDLEVGYSSGSAALNWAEGYLENPETLYVDYGGAEGCPEHEHTDGECVVDDSHGGWDQKVLYELSWENPVSDATPEIYYHGDEEEWAQISLWGNAHLPPEYVDQEFRGVLDEDGYDGSYSHTEAWDALGSELEAQGLFEFMEFSTTI